MICIILCVHFRNECACEKCSTFCWIYWQINRDKWHTLCRTLCACRCCCSWCRFVLFPYKLLLVCYRWCRHRYMSHLTILCDDTSVQTGKYLISCRFHREPRWCNKKKDDAGNKEQNRHTCVQNFVLLLFQFECFTEHEKQLKRKCNNKKKRTKASEYIFYIPFVRN